VACLVSLVACWALPSFGAHGFSLPVPAWFLLFPIVLADGERWTAFLAICVLVGLPILAFCATARYAAKRRERLRARAN
jgi:hypothetical protein